MYGIEKLKEVGADLAKFGMKIEDALDAEGPKGKKISLAEAVGLGVFAVPKALNHVNDAEEIRQEFKDLDPVEAGELSEHIADKLDLNVDSVENILEAGLDVLVSMNKLRVAIQGARTAA